MAFLQLQLPFQYSNEDLVISLPGMVKNFFYGISDGSELYTRKQVKIVSEDDKVEAFFPPRKKPYHSTYYSSRRARTLYGSSNLHFFQTIKDYDGFQKLQAYLPSWQQGDIVSQSTAFTPFYFRIKKAEDGKVIIDSAFSILRRNVDNRSSMIIGSDVLKGWIHTEFVFNEYTNSHLIDPKTSWYAFFSNHISTEIFAFKLEEIPGFTNDLGALYPWSMVAIMESVNAQWKNKLVDAVHNFVQNNLNIKLFSEHSFKVEKFVANVPVREGPSFAAEAAVAQNFKEFVDILIDAGLSKNGFENNIHIYPHFYKKVAEIFQELDLDTSRDSFVDALALLAFLCNFYEDPSILKFISNKEIVETSKVAGRLHRYGGRFSNFDINTIRGLLTSPFFAGFERAKQYRLIASCFNDQGGLIDALNMIAEMNGKNEDITKDIDRRRIKNITHLHDEIVKAYNAVKFKPVPIDPNHTKWLRDYGLDIPDTNITLVVPEDTNDVRFWGKTQNHCIGSYADRAVNGGFILLGVKDKDTDEWYGHLMCQNFNYIHRKALDRGRFISRGQTYTPRSQGFYTKYEPTKYEPLTSSKDIDSNAIVVYADMMAGCISQFYGKRNSAVDIDVKTAVYNHMAQAATEAIRSLYVQENDKGDNLVREQKQAVI